VFVCGVGLVSCFPFFVGLVGGVGVLFEICIVDVSVFCSACVHVFCVCGCEGRMVDALASRADEGRWSLR
jgi:hypothetical protein